MQTPKTDSMNELTSTSVVLETRLKELNKARQVINSVQSLEDFMNFKLKISQIFFDLDQEIRETLQNIKSAQLQNKEIANEKEFISMKINNLESKLLNSENFIGELKQNNKELVNQINFQQEKIIKNENLIMQMQAKLAKYEEASDSGKKLPDKFVNLMNEHNSGINNANFISLQPKAEKFNLDSIDKENYEKMNKVKNTITVRLHKEKDEFINHKDTSENLTNLNFNYNSPSISHKMEADSIYNQNNHYNHNADKDSISREDRFYLNKNVKENQNKSSIDAEKNSYKTLKSQRENSKKMLDNMLNENLFEFGDQNSIQNNYENNAETNSNMQANRENEAKLRKKIPEIKIENNNGTKIDSRFDMPKVNKITSNNLNNFHDEKRKIEETAGILSEETSHNLNSLNNLILSNSLQERKNQIASNNNYNNREASNANNYQVGGEYHQVNKYPDHANNGNYKSNEPNRNFNTIDKNIHENSTSNSNKNENSNNKNKNKNKPDRIIQIIMKIKTCPDTSAIISQLFGEDVLERIISPDAEEEMVNDIEQIISEIQTLKSNNNNYDNQDIEDNQANEEENVQNPRKQRIFKNNNNNDHYLNAPLQSNFPGNNKTNLYEYSNNTNSNSKNNQQLYDEISINHNNNNYNNNNKNNKVNNYGKRNYLITKDSSSKRLDYNTNPNMNNNFNHNLNLDSLTKHSNDVISENNLLKISGSKSNKNLNKSHSRVLLDDYREERPDKPKFESLLRNYKGINSNAKIFKNYTKKGSEFFDPTLQKGGISKLDYDDRKKRSKSRTRGVNENSVLCKSAEKSIIDRSYLTNKQQPNRNINYRENYQEILGRREYEFNYD